MKKEDFDIRVFASRLSLLLEQSDENTHTLARKLGLTPATISRYANGLMAPKVPTLYAMAEIFNVNPIWLFGFDAPKHQNNDNDFFEYDNIISMPKMRKIPLLGTIACGEPIFADEQKGEYVITEEGINADFCLKAKGDSMVGARINDGDIVFVQSCSAVENGEIAAVIIDDEATLKRVYYYPEQNKLILSAENPRYAPFVYENEQLEYVRIIGRAVAFQSVIV